MREKIWNAVSASVQKNKDQFVVFLKEKVGPTSLQMLKQEEVMRLILVRVHGTLPFPIRIVIGEDKFVELVMSNKERAARLLKPLFDAMGEGFEEGRREQQGIENDGGMGEDAGGMVSDDMLPSVEEWEQLGQNEQQDEAEK